jgi:hypothetical protein
MNRQYKPGASSSLFLFPSSFLTSEFFSSARKEGKRQKEQGKCFTELRTGLIYIAFKKNIFRGAPAPPRAND